MSIGKNSAFLNSFWDLASDEREKRVAAAGQIIEHVKGPQGGSVDTEYALKRLVRGLGSSRESARQGFVTCLCELLITVPSIAVGTTLALIDENTKISGSMKGAEERDLMFGKLFGYLSLIRCGKIEKDKDNVLLITDRLLELHNRKGWIREVVCESILSLLNVISSDIIVLIIPKLKELLGNNLLTISDMTAWQLMLCVGIQQISTAPGADLVKTGMLDLLPQSDIVTPSSFLEMTPTLLEATAGFPKLHRVWDFIMSAIYPMDSGRALPRKRPTTLSMKQEDMLNAFCAFIDKHLLPSTIEKRSVALKLSIELVRLSPAELIPTACSRSMVKCIFACRVNRKHVLHSLAGSVLSDLIAAVGANVPCRLALASCLVQYGGANFDTVTGTKAVSTLLEGLGAQEVASHVRFLCGVLSSSLLANSVALRNNSSDNSSGKGGSNEGEGEVEGEGDALDTFDDPAASATGAIEALSSLVRNTRLANRSYVCAAVVSVFVRLSCFSEGITKVAVVKEKVMDVEPKSSKRKAKKEEELPVLTGLNSDIIDAIRLVEGSVDGSSSSSTFKVSSDIAELAGAKLMAILADSGNLSLAQLDIPVSVASSVEESEKGSKRKGESEALSADLPHSTLLMDVAVATVEYLSTTGGLKLVRALEEDDDEEEGTSVLEVFSSAITSMRALSPLAASSLNLLTGPTLCASELEVPKSKKSKTVAVVGNDTTDSDASNNNNSSSGSSSDSIGKLRLRDSLYSLVGHSVFHTLTSRVVSVPALQDIAAVVTRITAEANGEDCALEKMKSEDDSDDDDDDDDDEEEERPQSLLFDASMEMLSVPGDHAVKGVRDAIKRVWNALCQVCVVDDDVIEAALAAVVGDDGEEEVSPEEMKAKTKGSKEKGEKRKRLEKEEEDDEDDDEENEDEEEEEEEEEDEVLTGVKAFDFLSTDFGMEDGEDEDNEEGLSSKAMQHMALQHSDEADEALSQMLALRRQSRKKGMLEAQRNQMLIRTRAIDILEILVHRAESSTTLLPLFLPMLRTLKKLQSAASTQIMQEGRAFEQRLRIIIEQKLCKKKFQLIAGSVDIGTVVAVAAIDEAVNDTGAKKGKQTKKMLEQQMEEKAEEDRKILEEQQEREESSAEMRQEITALTTEIFKYLSSAIAPLRPVALSALLCITRAAVSTPNTDTHCKTAISTAVQSAFLDFSSKKNSRLAPKVFEELIQRYPDFCVASFLNDLISSCSTAKSSFLRAECCRFLGEILKRHKSLQAGTLELLDSSLTNIVTSLGGAISYNFSSASLVEKDEVVEKQEKTGKNGKKSKKEIPVVVLDKIVSNEESQGDSNKVIIGSTEKEKEIRAKRLKPLLLCAKEMASLLKVQREKSSKSKGEAVKSLLAVMQSENVSGSSSPAIQRLIDQIVQLLTTPKETGGGGEENKAKKEKSANVSSTVPSVVNKINDGAKKEEKKARKEAREDKMVTSAGQTEQEEDDDALPVGEYVLAGAKGPNFKKKKGDKKESKQDQQEILDIAEKQLVKRMHEDKRQRASEEEAGREVEVEKKRKWHE